MKRLARLPHFQAQQHHRLVDLLNCAEQADLDLFGLAGTTQRLNAVDRLRVCREGLVDPALPREDIAAAVMDEGCRILVAQLPRQGNRAVVLRQRLVPARLSLVEKAELEMNIER